MYRKFIYKNRNHTQYEMPLKVWTKIWGHFYVKKEASRKYSPEFKLSVILDMSENYLSYRETVRKHWGTQSRTEEDLYMRTLKIWEHIYLEEGAEGFIKERRGRNAKGFNCREPDRKYLD